MNYGYEELFGIGAGITIFIWLIMFGVALVVTVFGIYCNVRIYQKAGYEWWKAIVPYYNLYIMTEFTIGNGWWFLLMFVPVVGIILTYVMFYRLAMCFGKSTLFGIGMIFIPIVFLAILAFEKENTYRTLEPLF